MSIRLRNRILAELARHTGKTMPAAFFKKAAEYAPGLDIERFHNLVTGIFKPAWSDYALCIRISLRSPYARKDEVITLDDGRWLMAYSPRSGGLGHHENRSFVRCLDDRQPFGVIQQVTEKAEGSTYKVLGLGIVSSYDSARDVFVVESADLPALAQVSAAIADEAERYQVQLYAQLTNDFRLTVRDERTGYTVSLRKRKEAFRQLLLTEYDYACAACNMRFVVDRLHEAQAAHIVPKRRNGTDDPRNGLVLCRGHHWAFDYGLFSLTPDHRIILSPLVSRADSYKFELLSLADKPLRRPERDAVLPHAKAIEWHRERVYRD